MNNLTAIIISKDDHDVIGDAINSLKGFAYEIIVVDSNNDNNTREICRKLKVTHIKHPFKNFSDQRNFGISHATTPWVFFLDSDERLSEDFINEANAVMSARSDESEIAGYYIYRKTFYFGQDWHFKDKVQRLFIRKKFVNWKGVVHETPVIDGKFGEIKSPILHLTHRNLSQMIRKTNEWSNYEAELRYKNGHPEIVPWRFARVMITEFLSSYIKNKGYKNGTYGVIEGVYQAFSIFISYSKLWEIQNSKK